VVARFSFYAGRGEVMTVIRLYPSGQEVPYQEGETVLLSEHFGKRPVALIFGSYT